MNLKISVNVSTLYRLSVFHYRLKIRSNLLIDNAKGIHEALAHLIKFHQRRRIAFIRGPQDHPEAELRYQAYLSTLNEFDIPLNLDLVTPGDFVFTSGKEAIRLLVDQRKIDFDALVGANDRMSIGAMEELQSRGFKIPEEIAIIGFDNIEQARFTTPPLTTIKQPFNDLGKLAVQTLLSMFSGNSVPDQIILPATLVVRQSCGCLMQDSTKGIIRAHITNSSELKPSFATQREDILKVLREVIPNDLPSKGNFTPSWMEQLLEAYTSELDGTQSDVLLPTLNWVMQWVPIPTNDFSIWQKVISVLRNHSLAYLSTFDELSRAEIIWEQARVLIGATAERAQGQAKLQVIENTLLLSEIGQSLLSSFEIDQLKTLIAQALFQLGIRSCYISLYENKGKTRKTAQLLLAYENGKVIEPLPEEQTFPASEIIPGGFLIEDRNRTMVIDPLYYQNEHLGFAVFEIGPLDGMIYETLRRQISSVLKGAILIQERAQVEEELKTHRDILEELVSSRTKELIITNEKLQDEIIERKRVATEIKLLNEELEKRVVERTAQLEKTNKELEAFSYSVSHDLRAPLRAINGYANILKEDHIEQLPREAQGYLNRIQKSAQRMDQLIRDLLAFSRLERLELRKQLTNCGLLVDQAIMELDEEIQKDQVDIYIDQLPNCQADPALLRQVFVNLLTNAIKFTRNNKTAKIQIGSQECDGKVAYFVKDNGVGFDMAYAENLFGVFQRFHKTDEFEGTGVGLAIVKRIITRHGGSIWAEAEVDKGATFYFTID